MEPNLNSNNLYEILGLNKECTQKEIKKVYRSLAKIYHPDSNSRTSSEENFRKVTKSYEILSNEKLREEYDEKLNAPKVDEEFLYNMWMNFSSGKSNFAEWENFFDKEELRGEDVNVYCRLSLEELKVGCNKIITLSTGRISIKIKPNSLPGTKLKVSGKGLDTEPPTNCPGDLYIQLVDKPHSEFKLLDSGDLIIVKTLTYQDLILGRDIHLNTLTGKVKLTIPPKSDLSKEYRLRGLGLGESGDIILKLKLFIPQKDLTKSEKDALNKLNKFSNLTTNSL